MVFLSINGVITDPSVSIPNVKGVTSKRTTSLMSPARTPAWIAAPIATHCIGSTPLSAFLPTNFSNAACTVGIRVGPPTKMTLSTSPGFILASLKACFIGFWHLEITGPTISSNLALVNSCSRCLGPLESDQIYGKFIVYLRVLLNSIFAFSAASCNLCRAA